MTDLTPDTPFRYLGVTDECVDCQRCGKADLRSTVILGVLDEDGNVVEVTYYGSTCAARALSLGRGGSRKVLDAARAAQRETAANAAFAREVLGRYGLRAEERPAELVLALAVAKYRRAHAHARWAAELSEAGWEQAVLRLWEVRSAMVREGELVGV